MFNLKKISIAISIAFLPLNCFSQTKQGDKIYIIGSDLSFQVSQDNGKSWQEVNAPFPEHMRAIKLMDSQNYIYMTTLSHGILRFNKKTQNWKNISSPEFVRPRIYKQKNEPREFRKISGFNIDRHNESKLIVATKHDLFISHNHGETWKRVPMRGLNKRNYITAVAIDGKKIYAGTSFNGIYKSQGYGFKRCGKNLPGEPYSGTLRFTEQVSSIQQLNNQIYAGMAFGKGIYKKRINSKRFKQYHPVKSNESIFDISGTKDAVYFSAGQAIYKNNSKEPRLSKTVKHIVEEKHPRLILFSSETKGTPSICVETGLTKSKERNNGAVKQKAKNAIYVSVPALRRNLQRYINLAKKTEINAFVIDMKDDFGNIYYKSLSKVAKEIGSLRKPLNMKGILKQLKANNIYSIARIVVFKDKKLFKGYNGKYTIKNKKTGNPWRGTPREFWVDPYSKFVHNYNIFLAQELEQLGFNEIQFDYIRFPSDGAINLCRFSYKKNKHTYKSEILGDFLRKAKQSLKVPISVDIYGFNSWYNFGNWIGQDIDELSEIVDTICPMVYPSHFGNSFYKRGNRRSRPYRIVLDGAKRSRRLIRRSIAIRPYLQAFNLLAPFWGPEYIKQQIEAAQEGGSLGYTLWNARGDYRVPEKALISLKNKK